MKKFLLICGILLSAFTMNAQDDATITGTVTDSETGESLPGTSIRIKGTNNGATTDIDGNYSIQASPTDVLVFSYIGYTKKEVTIGNRTVIDVSLGADVEALSEVLVIGYGSQKKSVSSAAISTADVDAMEKISVPNVGKSLQGLANGVNVSGVSGQPTSTPTILIRGIGTNGDNSPLVILDGLQANVSILNSLSPNDIESIQILKDAASTAIYGTSGANGVIVIQTKSGGKDGAMEFSYNGSYFVQSAWKVPEMLNSSEYVNIINEKYNNGGSALPAGFPQTGTNPAINTDWMNTIFQPSEIQNHNLSISKGSEKGSFFSSITYTNQEGIVAPEKSYLDRLTARFNSKSIINDYITFGQNASIIATSSSSIPENNEFGTPIADAIAYDPLTPIYDPNAQFGFAQSPFVQKEYINPLSRVFINNGQSEGIQVVGNLFLEVKPLPWLTLRTDVAVDRNSGNSSNYSPAYDLTPAFENETSDISENYYKFFQWQLENYFTITKEIEKHQFDLIGGHTAIKNTNKFFGGAGQDLPIEALANESLRYINLTPDSSQNAYSFANPALTKESFFGRLLYNFDERYLFTTSLRRDGSSSFGADKRYATFLASSLGWVVTNESFFNFDPIDYLKVRVSYGSNGNDRIPALAYTSQLNFLNTYQFGDASNQAVYYGAAPVRLSNPLLQWEASRQLDIGIEAKLFGSQLGIEVDYYRKLTDGLLLEDSSTPIFAGNNAPIANVGEILNTGFEFKIDYYKDIGELSLGATLNGTTLRNEVTKISSTGEFINGYSWPIRNTPITRMQVGDPLFYFRGYESTGVFGSQEEIFSYINSDGDLLQPDAEPGDLRYVDTNGDGEINVDDYTNIGKPWADFTFGLNLTANYRGFDANVLIAGQFGNQIYRTFERQDVPLNNYTTEWKDRWTETNPNGSYPRVVSGAHGAPDANNYSPSSFYVEDADFVRIKNIQIGYTLPSAIAERAEIRKLRVFFSVDNLLTLTGYSGFDPEIGVVNYNVAAANIDRGYYPQTRNIGGGLQVTF